MRAPAKQFNGDPAATDSTGVLRLPGFGNKKYDEDFRVTVCSHTPAAYSLRDFKLRSEPADSHTTLESVSRPCSPMRPREIKPVRTRLGLCKTCPRAR